MPWAGKVNKYLEDKQVIEIVLILDKEKSTYLVSFDKSLCVEEDEVSNLMKENKINELLDGLRTLIPSLLVKRDKENN
jgi:hypothetical protein